MSRFHPFFWPIVLVFTVSAIAAVETNVQSPGNTSFTIQIREDLPQAESIPQSQPLKPRDLEWAEVGESESTVKTQDQVVVLQKGLRVGDCYLVENIAHPTITVLPIGKNILISLKVNGKVQSWMGGEYKYVFSRFPNYVTVVITDKDANGDMILQSKVVYKTKKSATLTLEYKEEKVSLNI